MPHWHGRIAVWNLHPCPYSTSKKIALLHYIRPPIFGCVKEDVLWFEIQFCGLLHAHIILWIENSNFEQITNEITATVPDVFDTTLKRSWDYYRPRTDDHNIILYQAYLLHNPQSPTNMSFHLLCWMMCFIYYFFTMVWFEYRTANRTIIHLMVFVPP